MNAGVLVDDCGGMEGSRLLWMGVDRNSDGGVWMEIVVYP